ncbi:MAG TPA: hypothetical protein VNA04_09815 [Thermoanaerobaculia bacterium]|nr:hypothetical protein [Thermoanaerobaculia bacterium]
MKQTRREFLVTSAVVAGGTVLWAPVAGGGEPVPQHEMFEGDPYLATVDDGGLGGRSFEAARDHALRFRTPGADRDRCVLGLEI